MVTRLPTVNSDKGAWGDVLNTYLRVGHDAAGRHAGWCDVREYGATGDGQTDDAAAIQTAIDTASGGTLYLPPGIYAVSSPLVLASNLLVAGYGATLLCTDSALGSSGGHRPILRATDVEWLTIAGLALDGQADLWGATEFKYGIGLYGTQHVRLVDLNIYDCKGDGLYFDKSDAVASNTPCRHVLAENVVCRASYRNGIGILALEGGHFVNCQATDTAGTLPQCGLDIEPGAAAVCADLAFTRCDFLRSANAGVSVNAGGTGRQENYHFVDCTFAENTRGIGIIGQQVELRGCHLRDNAEEGFRLGDGAASDVAVIGGRIVRNGHQGARLIPSAGVAVSRVRFDGVTIAGNSLGHSGTYAGIQAGYSDGGTLAGLRLEHCTIGDYGGTETQQYGVLTGATASELSLIDNDLRGNSAAVVLLADDGESRIVRDNRGYAP